MSSLFLQPFQNFILFSSLLQAAKNVLSHAPGKPFIPAYAVCTAIIGFVYYFFWQEKREIFNLCLVEPQLEIELIIFFGLFELKYA